MSTPRRERPDDSVDEVLMCERSPSEHVLRGSKSFTARSFRSRNSGNNNLRVPSGKSNNENISASANDPPRLSLNDNANQQPVLGEIAPNGQLLRAVPYRLRPSPTPSLKKKKAEALVKHHGSPQHVRVTAGGRIVPSEQSPLTYPRYGYSAVKVNGGVVKFAPNLHGGHEFRDQATQENFIAQDENGNFCQIIDGVVKPIQIVNGNYQLERIPPNLVDQNNHRGLSWSGDRSASQDGHVRNMSHHGRFNPSEPSITAQIAALELEYSKLDSESKDLDKTEALYGKSMPKGALAVLISKRRELVTAKDKIRVSVKNLKTQPPSNAPRSPRAMANKPSFSPPRNRAQPFVHVQQPSNGNMVVQPYSPFYGGPFPAFAGTFGNTPMSFQEPFNGPQPWMVPASGMFVPPSAFMDGSIGPAFPPFPESLPAETAEKPTDGPPSPPEEVPATQIDGSRSVSGGNAASTKFTHAVPIRLPEAKQTTSVKSGLNPRSPIYRPSGLSRAQAAEDRPGKSVKDRAPTPLSPLHQLQPTTGGARQRPNKSEETISPNTKSAHMHSSSISSFDTADFFPRDTREYSTRQLAYPLRMEQSEDKENLKPDRHILKRDESPMTPPGQPHHDSNWNPVIPDNVFRKESSDSSQKAITKGPLGDPLFGEFSSRDLIPSRIGNLDPRDTAFELATLSNRNAHNISPKVKREYLFVEEDPAQFARASTSSLNSPDATSKDTENAPGYLLDFSKKPYEWIEGYQAGLQRRPVESNRMGDFLDGYCSGLLKSQPTRQRESRKDPSAFQAPPVIHEVDMRPSAHPEVCAPQEGSPIPVSHIALESMVHSMDTLKEAVFAPQNENAVLTPSTDGPHIDDQPVNLGAWAKANIDPRNGSAGFPFPTRTLSMIQRQGIMPASTTDTSVESSSRKPIDDTQNSYKQLPAIPSTDPDQAMFPASNRDATVDTNRVTSATSLDSALLGQIPGHGAYSSQLWGSQACLSTLAGIVTGKSDTSQLNHTQFDGSPYPPNNRITSNPFSATCGSRFHEGSLDGMSSPPASPPLLTSPIGSPSLSPTGTPSRDKKRDVQNGNQSKASSPAKAKFEHIAEKVGIKAASHGPIGAPGGISEPTSPTSGAAKRRWRDVWRSGRTKDASDQKELES